MVDVDTRTALELESEIGDEHDVIGASSLRDAVDEMQGAEFDLILCDVSPPANLGIKVYAAVRQLVPHVAERIVLLTDGASSEITQSFLASIPNPRFLKPIGVAFVREFLRARCR